VQALGGGGEGKVVVENRTERKGKEANPRQMKCPSTKWEKHKKEGWGKTLVKEGTREIVSPRFRKSGGYRKKTYQKGGIGHG